MHVGFTKPKKIYNKFTKKKVLYLIKIFYIKKYMYVKVVYYMHQNSMCAIEII